MARINLITNPSFSAGTSSWVGLNGATLSPYTGTDNAYIGTNSMEVIKAAVNSSGIGNTVAIPVTPGLPYAASAYVRTPVTIPTTQNANLILTIAWYTSGNALVEQDSSAIQIVSPLDGFDRLSVVVNAPVGASYALISITQVTAGTAGAPFYVDAVMFEQASYVGGYIDNFTQEQLTSIVNNALSVVEVPTIYDFELNADITINELVLNTIDENNVVWICTGLDGWWGQATPDIPDIARGIEDGSYDVDGRYEARIITLNGVILPPNKTFLPAARDSLVSATNLVRANGWLRVNQEPTRAALVRLNALPQFALTNARGRTDFSLSFKAADPILYDWNDADPNGLTTYTAAANSAALEVVNVGTASVTGVFTLTGPLGAGSYVFNAETTDIFTIMQDLRGPGLVASVTAKSLLSDVVTLTASAPTGLSVGDLIVVSGMGNPFDSVGAYSTVVACSDAGPYTVSYAQPNSSDVLSTSSSGSIALYQADVLQVDTYNHSVSYNGNNVGYRNMINTLADWVKIAPGTNPITLTDIIPVVSVIDKSITSTQALLTTAEPHRFVVGTEITVDLPTVANLVSKQLTSNVITLITDEPHGFSVGDQIVVQSTVVENIATKAVTSNVATLGTTALGSFAAGDSVIVALPTTQTIVSKGITTGNFVTIGTAVPHGYSVGDSVTLALPTSTTPVSRSATSNVVTINTSTAHNFSTNDNVTVTFPSAATAINKAISGTNVVITTSAAHNFNVGDHIVTAFPTTATLTNSRSFAGPSTYYATLNTTAAHNFSVGDQITVNVGITSTATVTSRTATTSTATLTIGTHGFSVGETVVVSGISNAQYNGTFSITGTTSTTITYAITGGTAEAPTSTSGSVSNTSISTGYNGTKIIETIPTSTSFTYLAYSQSVASTSTATGATASLTNNTNVLLNGTQTVTSVPDSTHFSYTD